MDPQILIRFAPFIGLHCLSAHDGVTHLRQFVPFRLFTFDR